MATKVKPLGGKAYHSIPHLPGSKAGPGEHYISGGQSRMCTERLKSKNECVFVEEKLDGSCMAVYRNGDIIVPLGRAGYPAVSAPYKHMRMFHNWVMGRIDTFLDLLLPGERVAGEWLVMAHGIKYDMPHMPFVAFDIIDEKHDKISRVDFWTRLSGILPTPYLVCQEPIEPERAMNMLGNGFHGAQDIAEGLVYRVERDSTVNFMAKYVRPDMHTGKYLDLPDSPKATTWNTWKD